MKIIVGLGNPGSEYAKTRHNAGFFAVDSLKLSLSPEDSTGFSYNKRFDAEIFESNSKGEKLIIIKPHTFMNLSGECVSRVMQFYKAGIDDLVVIHDDVDIPLGEARVKLSGGSAGHKGIQNIIDVLGSDEFVRVRIGIMPIDGSTEIMEDTGNSIDTKDFVLSKFADREQKVIANIIEIVNKYILQFIGSKEMIRATTLKTQNTA